MDIHILSSLEKVFPKDDLVDQSFTCATAFENETYAFQIAYKGNYKTLGVEVAGTAKDAIEIRSVGLVPSNFPIYEDHDEHIIKATPGMYPDPLYPLKDNTAPCYTDEWRSLWVTIHPCEYIDPGSHIIKILFKAEDGTVVGDCRFELNILPDNLPKQTLISTNWFHADCLATQYKVDVFSEAHWDLIDKYIKTSVAHGMNMLLTPLFTLPLDTQVGGSVRQLN